MVRVERFHVREFSQACERGWPDEDASTRGAPLFIGEERRDGFAG